MRSITPPSGAPHSATVSNSYKNKTKVFVSCTLCKNFEFDPAKQIKILSSWRDQPSTRWFGKCTSSRGLPNTPHIYAGVDVGPLLFLYA